MVNKYRAAIIAAGPGSAVVTEDQALSRIKFDLKSREKCQISDQNIQY